MSTTVPLVPSETTILGFVSHLALILHTPTLHRSFALPTARLTILMTQLTGVSAHARVLTSEIRLPSNVCSFVPLIRSNTSKYLIRVIDDAILIVLAHSIEIWRHCRV